MGKAIAITDQAAAPGLAPAPATNTPDVWQLPMMLYASRWNRSMAMFWLPKLSPPCVPHHDPHEQLIVPKAVAAESVPCLFA